MGSGPSHRHNPQIRSSVRLQPKEGEIVTDTNAYFPEQTSDCPHELPKAKITIPYMNCLHTFVNCARHWALEDPEREAFVFLRSDGSRLALTREKYFVLGEKFASVLSFFGLSKKDVVANALPNCPERVVTDLGVMILRAITLHVQPFLKEGNDVISNLMKTKAKVLIIDPIQKYGSWIGNLLGITCKGVLTLISTPVAPDLRWLVATHQGNLLDHLETSQAPLEPRGIKPDDIVYVFPAAKESGFMRLVCHTHASLLTNSFYVLDRDFRGDQRFYNESNFGWYCGFPLRYFACGSTRVVTDRSFTRHEDYLAFMWQNVQKERCEVVALYGKQIVQLLKRPEIWADNSFRPTRIVMWGSPLYPNMMRVIGSGFQVKLGPLEGEDENEDTDPYKCRKMADELRIIYYVTELGVVSSVTHRDFLLYEDNFVGFLLPGVQVIPSVSQVYCKCVPRVPQMYFKCIQVYSMFILRGFEKLFHL